MRRYDIISGFFLLFLSLAICTGAWLLKVGTLTEPTSGFFPMVTGLVLALFSIQIIVGARKLSSARVGFWAAEANRKGIYLALLFTLFYALFLEWLGFVISTIVFFILFSRFVSGHRWATAVFFGLAASISTYVVFSYLLHAPLPQGVVGGVF